MYEELFEKTMRVNEVYYGLYPRFKSDEKVNKELRGLSVRDLQGIADIGPGEGPFYNPFGVLNREEMLRIVQLTKEELERRGKSTARKRPDKQEGDVFEEIIKKYVEDKIRSFGGKVVDVGESKDTPGNIIVTIDFGKPLDYENEDDREFVSDAVESNLSAEEQASVGHYVLDVDSYPGREQMKDPELGEVEVVVKNLLE